MSANQVKAIRPIFFGNHDLDEAHGSVEIGGSLELGPGRQIYIIYQDEERRGQFELRPLVGDKQTWQFLAAQLKLSNIPGDSTQSIVFALPAILEHVSREELQKYGQIFLEFRPGLGLEMKICGLTVSFEVEAIFRDLAIERLILRLKEIKP